MPLGLVFKVFTLVWDVLDALRMGRINIPFASVKDIDIGIRELKNVRKMTF